MKRRNMFYCHENNKLLTSQDFCKTVFLTFKLQFDMNSKLFLFSIISCSPDVMETVVSLLSSNMKKLLETMN